MSGCQYDPYAHLYTTEKPEASAVAGRYKLKDQTVSAGGLSALHGKTSIVELRADRTFIATNVPPQQLGSPGTDFFNTLLSDSGTWRLDAVGGVDSGWGSIKTNWGIYFDSKAARISAAALTGKKPPYGLIFTLGDPDSGQAMILEKER